MEDLDKQQKEFMDALGGTANVSGAEEPNPVLTATDIPTANAEEVPDGGAEQRRSERKAEDVAPEENEDNNAETGEPMSVLRLIAERGLEGAAREALGPSPPVSPLLQGTSRLSSISFPRSPSSAPSLQRLERIVERQRFAVSELEAENERLQDELLTLRARLSDVRSDHRLEIEELTTERDHLFLQVSALEEEVRAMQAQSNPSSGHSFTGDSPEKDEIARLTGELEKALHHNRTLESRLRQLEAEVQVLKCSDSSTVECLTGLDLSGSSDGPIVGALQRMLAEAKVNLAEALGNNEVHKLDVQRYEQIIVDTKHELVQTKIQSENYVDMINELQATVAHLEAQLVAGGPAPGSSPVSSTRLSRFKSRSNSKAGTEASPIAGEGRGEGGEGEGGGSAADGGSSRPPSGSPDKASGGKTSRSWLPQSPLAWFGSRKGKGTSASPASDASPSIVESGPSSLSPSAASPPTKPPPPRAAGTSPKSSSPSSSPPPSPGSVTSMNSGASMQSSGSGGVVGVTHQGFLDFTSSGGDDPAALGVGSGVDASVAETALRPFDADGSTASANTSRYVV